MRSVERYLVYPMLLLLSWAVFGGHIPTREAAAEGRDMRLDTLQVKRVEVLDAKGRLAAMLGTSKSGSGALILLSEKHKPVLELGVRDDAGMVTLVRHADKARALLQLATDGKGHGQIALFSDKAGKASVVIGRTEAGGQISVRNAAGAAVATVTSTPGASGFMGVAGPDGTVRSFLSLTKHGGLVGVKDAAGEPSAMMHASEEGGVFQNSFEDEDDDEDEEKGK